MSNVYFVARWGNPREGPNGADTNLLVIAESKEEAARLADALLADYPWHQGPNVTDWCQSVMLLGVATPGPPRVIHGPWVMHAIVRGDEPPSWERHERDGPWIENEQGAAS